ncbi:hypothetical protein SAMN05216167_12721 [Spirosoma endophyticum]|uniref:Uncharacterized protein n=1 Tax=Spirosoma endophyticum TaxID=662367 RepID=A0A1I2FRC6_9BACT|nr:hypothetical protein SAMN05216167_12721 [Spirosoma endophyticum]
MDTGELRAFQPVCSGSVTTGTLASEMQSFFTIHPIHPFVVVTPAFPVQQHINPLITVPNPYSGNFFDSFPDHGPGHPLGLWAGKKPRFGLLPIVNQRGLPYRAAEELDLCSDLGPSLFSPLWLG